MADKLLRSLNGRKFAGSLAEPIDTNIVFPLMREGLWPELSERRHAELHRQRVAKMPELAKHLDIKFEHLDLTKHSDLVSLYGCIVENLAVRLIPGFQEKAAGKWPREVAVAILMWIEKGKQAGEYASDLDGCCDYLKKTEPDLARARNRSALEQKAKTVRNLVAKERAELKREHAKKLHRKPRLVSVKA
jgi:hypothetical protein